jgi:hypothetical protein
MADLFRNAGLAFPSFPTRNLGVGAGAGGFSGMTLVYILLGALVIFAVGLMLLNKPIDFSWVDPRPKSMQVTSDAYLFWKLSPFFTNLTVKDSEVPGFLPSEYTTNVDMVLKETRVYTGNSGNWRHLFHRGSDELASTTLAGALRKACGSPGANGSLPPYGLPKRMNPGVFLDPNVNDVIVFLDTAKGGNVYRESVRIKDIPMDKPFRLGLVVKDHVLEVYLNCRLEVSKILKALPMPVENNWYGLSGAAAAQAQMQNLYIWQRALPSDQMTTLCSSPVKFLLDRPICDAGESASLMPAVSAKKPADTDASKISYGNSLACRS